MFYLVSEQNHELNVQDQFASPQCKAKQCGPLAPLLSTNLGSNMTRHEILLLPSLLLASLNTHQMRELSHTSGPSQPKARRQVWEGHELE